MNVTRAIETGQFVLEAYEGQPGGYTPPLGYSVVAEFFVNDLANDLAPLKNRIMSPSANRKQPPDSGLTEKGLLQWIHA